MSDMLNQVAKGLWNKLKADGTLMTALGGNAGNGYKCYHVVAPQDASPPYITFGQITNFPIGTFASPTAIENETWWLNIFSSTGSKDVGDILDALTDVLDNSTLTVTGYTNLTTVREFVGNIIIDQDTETFQIPLRYRIWVDKN